MAQTLARHIHILPDHVANQIAAGEVVERPASVVKELVENSLDAGATRVRIELRNGGKALIRVADDGWGMSRPDALLCLDRHATSKIRSAEDLESVASFGFRGEALPSIAAVSRFVLETAPADGGPGTEVKVAGGRIVSSGEIARRPGTTVTVRTLFYNVPARAKFLRSAAAETRAVSEEVLLLALVHLATRFEMESNDRTLLELPPASAVAERVAAIWGDAEASQLLMLAEEVEGVRVGGLIQRPDAARPAGGRRYLFVNGRPFRDAGLLRELDDAYRTTVAPGLRPTAFIYLGVPPRAVDVNVHPSKSEVRFGEPGRVRSALRRTILGRLKDVASAPSIGRGRGPAPAVDERARPRRGGALGGTPQLAFFVPAAVNSEAADSTSGHAVTDERALATDRGPSASAASRAVSGDATSVAGASGVVAEGPTRADTWQLHDSYVLVATRQGLLIIDQHSAHERVLFEEIMRGFRDGTPSQRLLFPLTLRLSPAEYASVEELMGLLRATGFEVESFGDRTVIVHAAPHPHPYFDAEACFREMVHELAHGSELVDSARNQHEKIAKSMACKGAIKAGQRLSRAEMEELVDRLFATELPGHDVHGRPTILRLTTEELARRFGRA